MQEVFKANAGIVLEAVLIFGSVLVFGLWQIYAAKRDTRRASEMENEPENAKKLAASQMTTQPLIQTTARTEEAIAAQKVAR